MVWRRLPQWIAAVAVRVWPWRSLTRRGPPRCLPACVFGGAAGIVLYLEETLLASSRDGHHSFLQGGEWMLSDTYRDDDGIQHPFLYHLGSETLFAVAHLRTSPELAGTLRCDNHPRVSRDGRKVVVDSAHDRGRQMYLIDVGDILDSR